MQIESRQSVHRLPRRRGARSRAGTLAAGCLAAVAATSLAAGIAACADEERRLAPAAAASPRTRTIYDVANACVTLEATGGLALAAASDGARYELGEVAQAARFRLRASDLGVYLLRDERGGYLVADGERLGRTATLLSDTMLKDDAYVSPAEWVLEASPGGGATFRLQNLSTAAYLATTGTTSDPSAALDLALSPAEGCSEFPELSLDATGAVKKTHFADGDLFGVVDAHSHLFTNFGFGGAGVFHGSPFHRLGVEHALPDCSPFHGEDGRKDVLGYFFSSDSFDIDVGTATLLTGEIPEFDHHTAGYPDFTDWPRAIKNATHQTQYYRWIERAYLGGLRLIVQHATTNQVLCDLVTGIKAQTQRYSCNEMVSVERIFDETYALERYIDAQSGGPGRGWFRLVRTPAEAREVIGEGKLAVVLGIETSNLFDCFLIPRPGFPPCDAAMVRAKLDHFHERGVRVMFPVHKYDNAFSAGDGQRGFIELGSALNSGHYSNFTTDCDLSVPAPFDHGSVSFGGLNKPRDVYDAPPPMDFSKLSKAPIAALLPYVDIIGEPPLEGEYCQNAGLTPLGETLITEMMRRGMIIEIDHMPRRSYARAVEMLVENDYPAAGTHGSTARGQLYSLGGISTLGLPRCSGEAGEISSWLQERFDTIAAAGSYRAQGFGFDLNGLAGAPPPRFGPNSGCSTPQESPVTYPFSSYAGDVTFTVPTLGKRVVDFNSEGLVHLGLMPELVEDARRMGATDADLEPLFRSAEGYVRMWERAESRAAALRAAAP
jgi:microsomal dipeptidase-like Zn-dependent dipeptidase